MTSPNPNIYALERPLSRAQVLQELASMPSSLVKALQGASASDLLREPGEGEWSPFQTLLHLRDATLVYAIRFRFMAFDDEPLGAYEQRVPRKRREALIRRIAVARGTERQDLPQALPALNQKIDERVCLVAEIADSEPSRQRSWMQKNAAPPGIDHLIPSFIRVHLWFRLLCHFRSLSTYESRGGIETVIFPLIARARSFP